MTCKQPTKLKQPSNQPSKQASAEELDYRGATAPKKWPSSGPYLRAPGRGHGARAPTLYPPLVITYPVLRGGGQP